jgi:hypothetical protein
LTFRRKSKTKEGKSWNKDHRIYHKTQALIPQSKGLQALKNSFIKMRSELKIMPHKVEKINLHAKSFDICPF